MHYQAVELRRLLLNEAVGREVHADELAALAMREPTAFHASTLRVLAHSQRIRAMELRGQAAASAMQDDRGSEGRRNRREEPFT